MTKQQHVVVDEESATKIGEKFTIVFTGPTIESCEDWIAKQELIEPEKVHRGGYGID